MPLSCTTFLCLSRLDFAEKLDPQVSQVLLIVLYGIYFDDLVGYNTVGNICHNMDRWTSYHFDEISHDPQRDIFY